MSYPRNAASPPRIAIGPVVQISDGAVQTSGVSVKVKPEGGAASAGGGTVSYEEGIVAYVPTQAETDYTAFQVIAYKTGCIPAAVTVVTSASATAGHAGTDQSKIANPTSTVNLSNTTIKTATDVETDTADIQSRIGTPSNLGSGATVAANLVDIESQTDDIGAAGAGLTALGDARLDNLDATVSSRSTYAGADTSGTTTLLSRIGTPSNLGSGATVAGNLVDAEANNKIAGSTTAATNMKNIYGSLETGTAQAGGPSSITLQSGASTINDYYKDQAIFILSGTGARQTNRITAYNGGTNVATVSTPWAVQPDNTSVYDVVGRIG